MPPNSLRHLVNLLVKHRDARTLRALLPLDDASMLSRPFWGASKEVPPLQKITAEFRLAPLCSVLASKGGDAVAHW